MISVIIPTLQAEEDISDILVALMPAVMEGLIKEVIVSDGGSDDNSYEICDAMGAVFITGKAGRGYQLAAGGKMAQGKWLLFLHNDTHLEEGWVEAVQDFIRDAHFEMERQAENIASQAAYFRFGLDAKGVMPFLIEKAVALRCRFLGLPYGDQGLLISKAFYDQLGGYDEIPLLEDVVMVRKIGAKSLTCLPAIAKTSARRYHQDGYFKRIGRNFLCIMLYFAGVAPEKISHIYHVTQQKGKESSLGEN